MSDLIYEQIRDLEKDRSRLDWLQEKAAEPMKLSDPVETWEVWWVDETHRTRVVTVVGNLRDAIDAARGDSSD